MNELEKQVYQIILEEYCKEYTGKLKVTHNGNGYILRLYLHGTDNMPILIDVALKYNPFFSF